MKNKTYKFSNTQVQLPPSLAKTVLKAGRSLVKNSDLYSSSEGFEDEPHITVLYGIHADHPTLELIDLIETYPKFTITLGNVSLFKGTENNNPFDVVKIDVKSPDLHVLNKSIRNIMSYTSSYPEYIPHVTIAFVKADSSDHLEYNPTFKGLSFVVDRIIFDSSKTGKREIFLAKR